MRYNSAAMRAILQRVGRARVTVENRQTGAIGPGLLVLLGAAPQDTSADAALLLDRIAGLRIFEDGQGKMNLSLRDKGWPMLVVSQFTLYADCRKGRRPSFTGAAAPGLARSLVDEFIRLARASGLTVETGEFGASMMVELINQGPVTIWLDSNDWKNG
ncbi:MAG: D-aminoacyl-tRNA deacylase [Myxococcota bacterium]|nr:D-aminoacyl-tRNA deacylase [Myxococcota bacterium]